MRRILKFQRDRKIRKVDLEIVSPRVPPYFVRIPKIRLHFSRISLNNGGKGPHSKHYATKKFLAGPFDPMGNLISAEGKGWHTIIAYRAIFANIRGRWGVRRWKIVGLARQTRSIGGGISAAIVSRPCTRGRRVEGEE